MARKNRYEYSLLKETHRLLSSLRYSSNDDMDRAYRLLELINDFLDTEQVTLERSPARNRPVYNQWVYPWTGTGTNPWEATVTTSSGTSTSSNWDLLRQMGTAGVQYVSPQELQQCVRVDENTTSAVPAEEERPF